MSWFKKIGSGYSELWKAIIRPPREEYSEENLGPKEFVISKQRIKRTDIYLSNKRGLRIACSHFEPVKRIIPSLPCVIYLHGNSSSRLEALPSIEILLPLNITLFCFDFSGCGLSEGEYISLGHFEKDDVAVVIDYLRSIKTVSSIGIWGRSMGAVTAIMHSIRDPTIGGMVLDSPFMSLKILAEELCKEHTKIPKTILEAALKMIRKTILQRAGFDILQLEPIKYVRNTFVPAFFVAGKNDNFIKPHHAQNLCKYYAGDKNIVVVDGDHNDERPEFLMNSVSIFFYNCLQCELLFGKKMDTPSEKEGHNKTSIHNLKKENKIGNEKEINQALQFFGPEAKKFQEKLEKKNENRKESLKNNDEELWNKLQFSEFSKEDVEWNDKILDKEIAELLEKTDLIGSKKEETKSEKTENLKTLQKTNKEIKKVDVINDDLLDLKQNENVPKKTIST